VYLRKKDWSSGDHDSGKEKSLQERYYDNQEDLSKKKGSSLPVFMIFRILAITKASGKNHTPGKTRTLWLPGVK
jgi:hypothetical protein